MKLAIATLLACTAATTLVATSGPAAADAFHLDLEVDPTAYVFSGYSVHVGPGWDQFRLDLGVYAMDLPEFLHGNEGWDASFYGGGAKLQWFPLAARSRLFVDVSGGVSRQTYTLRATGAATRVTSFGLGVDAGWRFDLPYNLYVTPWAGLSYDFDAADVMQGGETFETPSVIPFAAVHVGYRFR